ncbi:MAG: DUF4845 domain-containing protein [Xanthomonadales bacterium]|nr:DUF4845 domain-containing protein [Xanthomonadales bacterium]
MKRISSQSGLTLTSFIVVLFVVGFFIYIGMKILPTYNEYHSVVSDMEGLAAEAGADKMSPEQIRERLFKRFNLSYVTSVKPENVKIVKQDGYQLTVAYEVRENLMYNLDYVAVFNKTVTVGGSGGG